jgi:hypothetical protein
VRRTVVAGLAGLAGAACVLGLAGTAMAAPAVVPHLVNSTIVQTGPADGPTLSMAGWYTDSFASLFTQVDGTFSLNAQAEGIGVSTVDGVNGAVSTDIVGAIGIQLCNESNGRAAQLGAVYLGGGQFAVGYLVGTLDGLSYNPCAGGGVLNGASSSTTFTNMGLVSVGSSIRARISQDGHGVLFSAMVVGGVATYTRYDSFSWFYPNEAAAGVQKGTVELSAPAINDLTDFTGVYTNDGVIQGGFDNWNAVQVDGSQDGMAPALLTPTSLTDVAGPAVCVRHWKHGYWKHHHHRGHWVTVCTSPTDASSSFSVEAGTPTGP